MSKRRSALIEEPSQSYRASTLPSHHEAVARVISAMREQLNAPLMLRDMAKIAYVSPFHFNRVFHQVTGIPPTQFLWALRLEEAKRLLLTTTRSVTDVCFDVGYNSLGTFITRFTRLVGLSPRHLRRMADNLSPSSMPQLFGTGGRGLDDLLPSHGVAGRIKAPANFEGIIFVGLFSTPIPQCRPEAGTLLTAPGPYRIGCPTDGCYYVFAAALSKSKDPLAYLLPAASDLLVGVGERQVVIRDGVASGVDVTLRPMRVTDPPILIALPALLFDRLGGGGGGLSV